MREQPGYLFLLESDKNFWEFQLKFEQLQPKTMSFKGKTLNPKIKGYFQKLKCKNTNSQLEFKRDQGLELEHYKKPQIC